VQVHDKKEFAARGGTRRIDNRSGPNFKNGGSRLRRQPKRNFASWLTSTVTNYYVLRGGERGRFVSMSESSHVRRVRFASVAMIISGVCFVLFPLFRPFFDESSLQGAAHFASSRWVLAHSFGMAGFLFLALGLMGVYARLRETGSERGAFVALVLSWVGAALTLPFFGAEAFSLQVVGRTVVAQNNIALLPMVNEIRFGPGIFFIGIGLLTLAACAVVLAAAIWRSRILSRWSGIPLAAGFVVYIPQLQGSPVFQPIRIAVGIIIAAGCIWIATTIWRPGTKETISRRSHG
jgi:hypothetical protein